MSAQRDPLDGYRGNVVEFARSVVRESSKPDSILWDRVYVGSAALKLMNGVASREDITQVMARVVAQCELDIQQSCKEFIAEVDPGSPKARKAHFEARVSASIVGRLNQMVADAVAAEAEYNNPEDMHHDH